MLWTNPLTIFESLSLSMLISNLATVIGFILALYFAVSYTKIFYEGRPKPKSWNYIEYGLFFICITEIVQFSLLYRINPHVIEGIVSLCSEIIGVIWVGWGCFLLYKEVP